jgi:hypothetical protein
MITIVVPEWLVWLWLSSVAVSLLLSFARAVRS